MIVRHTLVSFALAACLIGCSETSEADLAAQNAADAALDAAGNAIDAAGNEAAAPGKGETAEARTKRLREKAKTDPEGADAEAIDNMSRNEVIATAINSAGYLCARVVSAYPVGGNINVECVEYRSGKGRVKYRIDANAGTVAPR